MSFSKRIYNHDLVYQNNFMIVLDGGDIHSREVKARVDYADIHTCYILAVPGRVLLVRNTHPFGPILKVVRH